MKKSLSALMFFLLKLMFGMLLTVVLFAIYATLLYYTGLSEDNEIRVVYIASIVGIAFSGFLNAGGKKINGWLHGSLAGLGYIVILLTANKILSNWEIKSNLNLISVYIVSSLVVGCIGGILGINLRQRYRSKEDS